LLPEWSSLKSEEAVKKRRHLDGFRWVCWHSWAIVGDLLVLMGYCRNLRESWAFVGDFRYLWAISGFDAVCLGCCAGLLG
jgi:hypothetical protein